MIFRTLLSVFLVWSGGSARAEVTVFAAASLKEPLDQLAADFGDVTVSYGGSGTLARQIMLGAPADIVVSANEDWIAFLVEGGHVQEEGVVTLASNRLVLIGGVDTPDLALEANAIEAAIGDGRIAIGLVEAVPAGIYAQAAMQNLNIWERFADRLAEVDNVRAALALVARGEAPLGVVYTTDVRASAAVRVLTTFPADSHPPIRYVAAQVSGAPEAATFLATLVGAEGRAAFADAGFLPPSVDAE